MKNVPHKPLVPSVRHLLAPVRRLAETHRTTTVTLTAHARRGFNSPRHALSLIPKRCGRGLGTRLDVHCTTDMHTHTGMYIHVCMHVYTHVHVHVHIMNNIHANAPCILSMMSTHAHTCWMFVSNRYVQRVYTELCTSTYYVHTHQACTHPNSSTTSLFNICCGAVMLFSLTSSSSWKDSCLQWKQA